MSEKEEKTEAKDSKDKEDKDKTNDESRVEEKTGMKPTDILKAPKDPPSVSDDRAPTKKQRDFFIGGLVILIFALLVYPLAGLYLSIALAVIAIVVIATSVLVRVED